ncbi:hypothetical protein AVEN_139883-1 [Araneus ventricosus]|uniref:Uncharacterized protein n=1 Tax=Araneus ventricosus TaxID=182803 RepID=A0A4Y2FPE4_ARAVE|nr:hypothetical protein AVEN_139883-1 [Araneus ventricosus]
MFRKILRTVLTGMSKVWEISRALHVRKALLDASCNAVTTSSTDVEATLCHISRQMNPTLRIYQSSYSDLMQSSDQSHFINPLMSGISSMQLPHSHLSCGKASQAEPDPSMLES